MSAVIREIHDIFYPPPPPGWGSMVLTIPKFFWGLGFAVLNKAMTFIAWLVGVPAYVLTWPAFLTLKMLGFRKYNFIWDAILFCLATTVTYFLWRRYRRYIPVALARAAQAKTDEVEKNTRWVYQRLSSASTDIGDAVNIAKGALQTLSSMKKDQHKSKEEKDEEARKREQEIKGSRRFFQ